jgi:hypothetical protein
MVESDWFTFATLRDRAAHEHALSNFTVGYLVLDEPEYVLLAQTMTPGVDGEPLYGNVTQIPRCAIRSVDAASV